MYKTHRFYFILLAIIFNMVTLVAANEGNQKDDLFIEIQSADIIAGFRNNEDLFNTCRMLFEVDSTVLLPFSSAGQNNDNPAKLDLWFDSHCWVLRMPGESCSRLDLFDKVSMDLPFFSAEYLDVEFLFFQEKGSPQLRRWVRATGDRYAKGIEGEKLDALSNFSHEMPPFVNVSGFPTNKDSRTLIEHFCKNETGLQILGRHSINGNPCVVVTWKDIRESTHKPENIGSRVFQWTDYFKAWIDVKKGCLPVRIEKRVFIILDGERITPQQEYDISTEPSEKDVSTVMETEGACEYSNGGWYPKKIIEGSYFITPGYRGPILTLEEIVEKKKTISIPVSRREETTFKIIDLLVDKPIPKELSHFQFPGKTLVYNESLQKNYIIGMTDKEYETLLVNEAKNASMFGTAPDSGMNGVLPDPNSKWVPEDWIPRAPQGYGRTFFIIGVNLVVLGFIARYIFLRRKRS